MSNNPINTVANHKFGWLFTTIFSASFAYFQYKHSTTFAIASLFLALIFWLVTICIPSALAPLNRAWFALSLILGKVVSPIILSIIFFALITPVAVVTRILGRDELLLKKRHVTSYWVHKELIDPESFKNQF